MEQFDFSVSTTHLRPHLLLLTEYLPRPLHEDILVELVFPPASSLLSLDTAPAPSPSATATTPLGGGGGAADKGQTHKQGEPAAADEDEMLRSVLAREAAASSATAQEKTALSTSVRVYYSASSRLLVWAVLLHPANAGAAAGAAAAATSLRLQYRVSWPDGQSIRQDEDDGDGEY